jgi:carboxypeptidase C (cathepsin A)
VLDFASIDFERQRNDRAHALYLPTYAAIAQYHGRLGRKSLKKAIADAEEYAAREYPWVLARGDRLTAKERSAAVRRIASLTGLTEDYVDRADLRIEHWRFFGELLRHERRTVGRLDGRFSGPSASAIAERMDADVSMDAIRGPYAATFNHYVRDELGYENDLPYEQLTSRVQPWSYKDFEGRPVDVTQLLERAMRANPHLQVHVAYGYYDGATPYFASEDVVAHLQIPDELRANIKDLAAFVTRAAGG